MKGFQTIAWFLWSDDIWNEDQVWPPRVCKQKCSSFYTDHLTGDGHVCPLFALSFPPKQHAHIPARDFGNLQSKGTRQSRDASPPPAPLAAAKRGTCPAPARHWYAAALPTPRHERPPTSLCLIPGFVGFLCFNAGASGFHREPCTMTKWWAGLVSVAEATANDRDRPRQALNLQREFKRYSLKAHMFLDFFACFLFPCRHSKMQRAQAETVTPN